MSSIRHSLLFSRLPVPYWQDGLNIYVQFQESATTMLSIQTVNGFLNKMGNTWASNLMCDHWSSPILRGFNKAGPKYGRSAVGDSCHGFGARESPMSSSWHCGWPELHTTQLSFYHRYPWDWPVLACVMCMSACVPLQLERHFSASVYSAGWVVCYIVMS